MAIVAFMGLGRMGSGMAGRLLACGHELRVFNRTAAYKLLLNLLGAVQIASAAETMAIAERIGLDLREVADALASGQAASPQVVRNTRRIAEDHHDRDILFTPQLRLKDVEYALSLAHKFAIGSPFGALAGRMFRELCVRHPEPVNESKIVVASTNDPFVTLERAEALASAWGSVFVNIGDAGHINSASGFGEWPEGFALLRGLQAGFDV